MIHTDLYFGIQLLIGMRGELLPCFCLYFAKKIKINLKIHTHLIYSMLKM